MDNVDNNLDEIQQISMPVAVEVPQGEFKDPRKAIKHVVVFPATYQRPQNMEDEVYQLPEKLLTYPKKYPFELDPFQKASCAAVERNESVLVCAHTSAGKTVIAEYAIALCMQRGQKVVYTSPIKALSNQKFRDMQLEYLKKQEEAIANHSTEHISTVGLLTGDTTINKNADILIMTTEILRTLLQTNSDICREIGCVIFDEVHYMKNDERGSVWENTIAMLDTRIPMVFLSATIYNSVEFASWISSITNKIVHAVYTEYRPVPLQFFLMPMQSTQAYRIASSDDKNTIDIENLQRCCQSLPSSSYVTKVTKTQQYDTILNAVNFLNPDSLPAIIFTLSRQKCTEQAVFVSKQLRFNPLTQQERQQVQDLFQAAMEQLNPEDRQLPQVLQTQSLLLKGVAVHHSGLIPTIKELIELLFSLDLIKIIFVTETFAMGLNLPAKTVLFTDLMKFDGIQSRCLSSSEFIQMAGRSGRRGKDTQGLVIILVASQLQAETACKLIQQPAESLNSAYKIQWGQNDITLIKKSFKQFQWTCRLQKVKSQMKIKEEIKDSIEQQLNNKKCDYENIMNKIGLHQIQSQLLTEQQQILSMKDIRSIARVGNLVKVFDGQQSFIGIIVGLNQINGQSFYQVLRVTFKQNNDTQKPHTIQLALLQQPTCSDWTDWAQVANGELERNDETMQDDKLSWLYNTDEQQPKINLNVYNALSGLYSQNFDILTYVIFKTLIEQQANKTIRNDAKVMMQKCKLPYFKNQSYQYKVYKVQQSAIQYVYDFNIKVLQFQQKPNYQQVENDLINKLIKIARIQYKNYSKSFNIWQVYEKMYYSMIKAINMTNQIITESDKQQYQSLQQKLEKLKTIDDQLEAKAIQVQQIQNIESLYNVNNWIYVANSILSNTSQLVLSLDYQCKQKVLQELHYDQKDSIKSILISHLDSINSLLLTELITIGLFNQIQPELFAAIIASLLQEVGDDDYSIKESQSDLYQVLKQLKEKVDQLNDLCHLNNTQLEYNKQQTEQLINQLSAQIGYKWAQGTNLQEIMQLSKQLFEGNVIRMLKRVVNVLQQIQQAAHIVNLQDLEQLCEKTLLLVNRGLVKQQSLYVISEEEN